MSDLSDDVVAEAPIPPAEPNYGYGDRLTQARLAGHGWGDVDRFLNDGTNAAQAEGFTDHDIRDYLGLSPPEVPQARMTADAANRLTNDEDFAAKLKSTGKPLAITPLEQMSAGRMADHGDLMMPTSVLMPEDGKPLEPSGLDLNDTYMRTSYARSLLNNEVRSPRDFAERYAGALGGVNAGTDTGLFVRAAGELASSLPSDRDFTDQAISIAHSSGVALDGDTVKTVRNNLIDHWTNTGQPLEDTYKQAYNDPEVAATLTTPKQPPKSMVEQFAEIPNAEIMQHQEMSDWLVDRAKNWYAWRMQQPDATQEGWDKAVQDAHETLTTGKLSDEALNTALGFAGGTIREVGAKFGEAIGLLKPVEPMVNLLDPAAAPGTPAVQVPFSQLFSDKTRALVDTLSNAASRLGDIAGDLKDKFHQSVAAQLADDIHVGEPRPGAEPITVWHASPHDFDRFDVSKVGTGEGNAGHGVGLYFAENPKVHEFYKDTFSKIEPPDFEGGNLSPEGAREARSLGAHEYYDQLDQIREHFDAEGSNWQDKMSPEGVHDLRYLDNLDWDSAQKTPGNSYKTNLHVDPDKLLHLDEPISQQPESTQAAVAKLVEEHNMMGSRWTENERGNYKEEVPWTNDATGRAFFEDLWAKLGGGKEGEVAASQALQKAGFDGTKYLDGESRIYAPGITKQTIAALKDEIERHREQIADIRERPEGDPMNLVGGHENSIRYKEDYIASLERPRDLTHNYVIFDDAKMEMLEKNGTPIKPADVARQVDAVSQGQEATKGLFGFIKNLGVDLVHDESGSLNVLRTPESEAKRAAYTDSRDFMRPLITQMRSRGEQQIAHLTHQVDNWKTVSGQVENLFKILEPHMKEWEGELAKGINGNPMNTMIGNLIQYVEGRSMGAAIRHDSNLAPVADGIRFINEHVRGMLEDGFKRGVINQNSYFEDYFRHMWKDPNKAALAFEEFQSRVGKLGSSGGLMQRTLPTFEDGIKMGLEPAIKNPLELTLFDAAQKIKYLQAGEILEFARTAVKDPTTGKTYVNWRMSPQGDEVALNSHRTTKGIPNDPKGRDLTAYANPGLANTWNDWLSKGFHERPGVTSTMYDKMQYTMNTANGLALALPTYHFLAETVEASAGALGHAMSALYGGHILEATKELALATPGVSMARATYSGGKFIKDYLNLVPNRAMQALVDSGFRYGPRQEIYKFGSAQSYGSAIRRGQLINEIVSGLKGVLGDAKEPMAYRISHAVPRYLSFATREFGRDMNFITGPLFDYMIPRLKAYNATRKMELYLRDNLTATKAQIDLRASQINRNTDERLGEMNMDNTYWPKAIKQSTQLAMISQGWVYGWVRQLAAAGQVNIERMAFEKNPVAIQSLANFFAAYGVVNSAYQYVKTGQAPWNTDTPISDMLMPRTGGTNQWGSPERTFVPSHAKELFDYFKIGAAAMHSPGEGAKEGANYVTGKFKNIIQFLNGVRTGKDAIGHDIEHTAGGWGGFFAKSFMPIFESSLDDRKIGTNISPAEAIMGFKPVTKAAQDPAAFFEGLWKQDRKLYKQEIGRAKYENKIYINKREIPVDPERGKSAPAGAATDQMKAFRDFQAKQGQAPGRPAAPTAAAADPMKAFREFQAKQGR